MRHVADEKTNFGPCRQVSQMARVSAVWTRTQLTAARGAPSIMLLQCVRRPTRLERRFMTASISDPVNVIHSSRRLLVVLRQLLNSMAESVFRYECKVL